MCTLRDASLINMSWQLISEYWCFQFADKSRAVLGSVLMIEEEKDDDITHTQPLWLSKG